MCARRGDDRNHDANDAMERYAGGERAAFAELYDLVGPRLYRYFYRQTRDGAAAEDLVQLTLLRVHQARGTFHRGAEVVPWVFAIGRNLLIDRCRRRGRELSVCVAEAEAAYSAAVDPDGTAEHLVLTRELAERIARELQRIPDTQRAAFELVKQEGLSVQDAANALGTTVSAVKLRAHRAYCAIRRVLADAPGGN